MYYIHLFLLYVVRDCVPFSSGDSALCRSEWKATKNTSHRHDNKGGNKALVHSRARTRARARRHARHAFVTEAGCYFKAVVTLLLHHIIFDQRNRK